MPAAQLDSLLPTLLTHSKHSRTRDGRVAIESVDIREAAAELGISFPFTTAELSKAIDRLECSSRAPKGQRGARYCFTESAIKEMESAGASMEST